MTQTPPAEAPKKGKAPKKDDRLWICDGEVRTAQDIHANEESPFPDRPEVVPVDMKLLKSIKTPHVHFRGKDGIDGLSVDDIVTFADNGFVLAEPARYIKRDGTHARDALQKIVYRECSRRRDRVNRVWQRTLRHFYPVPCWNGPHTEFGLRVGREREDEANLSGLRD